MTPQRCTREHLCGYDEPCNGWPRYTWIEECLCHQTPHLRVCLIYNKRRLDERVQRHGSFTSREHVELLNGEGLNPRIHCGESS